MNLLPPRGSRLEKPQGQEGNNKLNLLWPEMAHLGPFLDPEIPLKKSMGVPFCATSQELGT